MPGGRGIFLPGEVADLIDDKYLVLGQDPEFVQQTVLEMGFFKLLNELMEVDVVGRKAMPGRHKAQGGDPMGFAYTRRRYPIKFRVNGKR